MLQQYRHYLRHKLILIFKLTAFNCVADKNTPGSLLTFLTSALWRKRDALSGLCSVKKIFAYFLLNAIQQRPVGFAGSSEGHHGQQLGLLADHSFLRREKSRSVWSLKQLLNSCKWNIVKAGHSSTIPHKHLGNLVPFWQLLFDWLLPSQLHTAHTQKAALVVISEHTHEKILW